MVNYGIVGVGYFGAELARFMNEEPDAHVSMVFDPENGQAIAEELQCDCAQSLEELVSSPKVDCVIVATPNYLHKEPVLLAAKNKKHVFWPTKHACWQKTKKMYPGQLRHLF